MEFRNSDSLAIVCQGKLVQAIRQRRTGQSLTSRILLFKLLELICGDIAQYSFGQAILAD